MIDLNRLDEYTEALDYDNKRINETAGECIEHSDIGCYCMDCEHSGYCASTNFYTGGFAALKQAIEYEKQNGA